MRGPSKDNAAIPASLVLWVVICAFLFPAAVHATKTLTITVPNGAIYRLNPDELSLSTTWIDTLTFFSGNYIAHAATVKGSTGSSSTKKIFLSLLCLLFPQIGLIQAVDGMQSCAAFATNEL